MAQTNDRTGGFAIFPNRQIRIVPITEVAANDSDKTLTVPASEDGGNVVWEVLSLYASLATTATAGERQVVALVTDGTYPLGKFYANTTQPESTTEYYQFGIGEVAEDVPVQDIEMHHVPLIPNLLPTGYTIRIYDVNAIAAAADDLSIYGLVREFVSS